MQRSAVVKVQRLLINSQFQAIQRNLMSATRKMSSVEQYNFETLKITSPSEYVFQVEINRPEKRNAMNTTCWTEIGACFNKLATDSNCRAVVLSGAGKIFTSGIDLTSLSSEMTSSGDDDVARKALHLRQFIKNFQDSFTVIERCPKPVIAAVHGACIGAGVDLICACDIRYCTQDAWFQIKEIDLGIVADIGTLQRFPKIVGNDSLARELCYSARRFETDEAKQIGFVSRVFSERDSLVAGALELARLIASKSPVAVQGTKESLVYARDHSVEESLLQVRTLNQVLLQSEDVLKATMAMMNKETPVFSKL